MIRKSKKRDAIYEALRSSKAHPSAEALYTSLKAQIPDLSLGTVYSNLSAFKKEGTVLSVGIVDGKERFDGDTSPHVHFICRACGAVSDLTGVPVPDAAYPAIKHRIDGFQFSYYGICDECLIRINDNMKE